MLKKILISLIVCIGLTAGLYFAANYWIEEKLPKLLGDHVNVKKTQFDLFDRSIRFIQPTFLIDSSTNETNLNIYATAQEIGIRGFRLWDLITKNKIGVEKFYIDSLDFEVVLPSSEATDEDHTEINLFVREIFTKIQVSVFNLNGGHILIKNDKGKTKWLEIHGFDLAAEQVLIDTATITHLLPLEFKKPSIAMDSIYLLFGGDYTLTTENLTIVDTSLTVKNLQIHSIYSKTAFVKANKYEKARIDLAVQEMKIDRLLWDVKEDSTISITSSMMACEAIKLWVFKDKTPPIEPPNIKPLLAGLINQLPFNLTIDTITWRKSYIAYEQLPVVFPRSGIIFFDNIYLSAYHISNDNSYITKHPTAIIDAIGQFMGEGDIAMTIKLELNAPLQDFSVKGSLGPMPITYINQALAPLTGIEAEGNVEKMLFEFSGNEYASSGKLIFEYHDLKITSYDKKREKEWLKSFFGNLILNNKNNVESKLNYKVGEISFVRYQNKGFFNYLWNSLRTGLLDIVIPFNNNPDKERKPNAPTKYKEDD
jgi:hypothetical protein